MGLPVRRQTWCAGLGGPAVAACLLLGMLPGITTAAAAEIKIGVVNVREVFARYKKAEDLQKADKEKFEPRRKELELRRGELRRRAREFRQIGGETGPEAKRLSEAKRHREAKEIEHQEYLFNLDHRQFQRDVQAANERLMRRLWDDLAAACRRVAGAEGYDLVLRSYGSYRSAAPQREPATDRERLEALRLDALLYVAPSVDITERVLEVLEKAYRRGIKLVPDDRNDDTDQPLEGGHG